MKKVILLVAVIATIFAKPGFAQNTPSQNILSSYYDIKNALVGTDAATASAKANDFVNALNTVDAKSLAAADQKTFAESKPQLIADAKHIADSKDAEHQRASFATLSANLFKLTKTVKLTDATVYYDYCPMKKAYWLSADAAIKNPYFGKQMLTCGKVSETLNK